MANNNNSNDKHANKKEEFDKFMRKIENKIERNNNNNEWEQ